MHNAHDLNITPSVRKLTETRRFIDFRVLSSALGVVYRV